MVKQSQKDTPEERGIFEYITDTDAFRHFYTILIPELLNVVPQTLNTIGQSIQKESASDQTNNLSELFQRVDMVKWAETISTWVSISNTVQSEKPNFLSQHLSPAVDALLTQIDFADLKDSFKQAAEDISVLSEKVNTVLWNYPAKMVLICSLIPLAGNTAFLIAKNTLKHFNAVPPDALADIMVSLIKEVNIDQLSTLIDEFTELVRKIHTGSALIGEPGYDAISQQISRIVDKLTSSLDKETLHKAKQSIRTIKTAIREARINAIKNDPELLSNTVHQYFDQMNQEMKNMAVVAEAIDDLPDAILSETIGNHIKDMDLTEGAEIINTVIQQIIRLNIMDPEGMQTSLFQWIDTVDIDLLETIAKQMVPQVLEHLMPIIQKISPPLINAFCDAMDKDESLELAIQRLKDEVFA